MSSQITHRQSVRYGQCSSVNINVIGMSVIFFTLDRSRRVI